MAAVGYLLSYLLDLSDHSDNKTRCNVYVFFVMPIHGTVNSSGGRTFRLDAKGGLSRPVGGETLC